MPFIRTDPRTGVTASIDDRPRDEIRYPDPPHWCSDDTRQYQQIDQRIVWERPTGSGWARQRIAEPNNKGAQWQPTQLLWRTVHDGIVRSEPLPEVMSDETADQVIKGLLLARSLGDTRAVV